MEIIRKPFQGIKNIIYFNWHLYIIALVLILCLLFTSYHFGNLISVISNTLIIFIITSSCVSLLISYYIYDFSDLYELKWIKENENCESILNINAGFDETSNLIKTKFPNSKFTALDFYDSEKNTEVSIKRAQKKYPKFPGTKKTNINELKFKNNSIDKIFVIFSAHEIRNIKEKEAFFKELNRIIKPKGVIYITEHLRDLPNFIAFNLGFFHFYSKKYWLKTFKKTQLNVFKEIKTTPFISTFKLQKNGNTP